MGIFFVINFVVFLHGLIDIFSKNKTFLIFWISILTSIAALSFFSKVFYDEKENKRKTDIRKEV